MDHPLIQNIDDLSIEQLQEKIAELTKKNGIAHRLGNAQLRHQVQMALDTYQTKYREKLMNQKRTDSDPDFGSKIDVS